MVADTPDANSPPPESGPPDPAETMAVVADPPREVAEADASSPVLNRALRESMLELNSRIHWLLGFLVVIASLYTCYFTSELILPILLAAFFALLLSPLMKRLTGRWVPRWIAALLLVSLTLATFVGFARVQSDKHHWYDVAAGAAIGTA